MKTIFFLINTFIVIEFVAMAAKNDLCADTNNNPLIFESLMFENRVLLMVGKSNEEKLLFGVNGFKYDPQTYDITFDSIERLKSQTIVKHFENAFLLFNIRDPEFLPKGSNTSGPLRAVAIKYQKLTGEKVLGLEGWLFDLNDKFEPINVKRIDVDPYTYRPDPTNTLYLSYLFRKFPDIDVHNRWISVMNLPVFQSKTRLFVYYLEIAPKGLVKPGDFNYSFRRHLFVRNPLIIEGTGVNESDWIHDKDNYNCFEEPDIVNATLPLTELLAHPKDRKQLYFDILYISNDLYYIYGVDINPVKPKGQMAKQLSMKKYGWIPNLFQCVETTNKFETTEITASEGQPTFPTVEPKSGAQPSLSSSSLLVTIMAAIVLLSQINWFSLDQSDNCPQKCSLLL